MCEAKPPLTAPQPAGAATEPVSVLLVPGTVDPAARAELVGQLGDERFAEVERILVARVIEWARRFGAGRIYAAGADSLSLPGAPGGDVAVIDVDGEGTSRRLRRGVDQVFRDGAGAVVVAWPSLPMWRAAHADGALGDLRAGCDVSVGPVLDGGFYLLALARPVPALFDLPDDSWASPAAMGRILTAAHEAGLSAGLLRAERGLRRSADVAAALADPLLDTELRRVLR